LAAIVWLLLCAAVSAETHLPPERIASVVLPNAYRVADKVISGGQPEGAAGFAQLRALGVRTIISVDGATPDLALAKQLGLRYVHLPHGYDGIPKERVHELAKAIRDLPGPIYIHCHHGKHRSPAAAAVACVAAGLLPPDAALGVLKTAGTSESYQGLYQSALAARRLDDRLLDGLAAEFPETARLPPIAEAMVEMEHVHDHLKVLAAGGWKRLDRQPDLDPAHEALLLKEHYHELLRSADVESKPAEFRERLQQGERAAESLETVLRAWQESGSPATLPAAIGESFGAVSQSCVTCHAKFRDVPLPEKRK
jgi:protein tyrosine phosphatase (PTP) superfamily phosphohydrolase (DUF442 family)